MPDDADFAFHPPTLAEAYSRSNARSAAQTPEEKFKEALRVVVPRANYPKLNDLGE